MQRVIQFLRDTAMNGRRFGESTLRDTRPWDPLTNELVNVGRVPNPALELTSCASMGSVVVALGTYGVGRCSSYGRWDPGMDLTDNCNHMWLLLVLDGDDLRTHHSVEIGGVNVAQVEGEDRKYFLIHLWYYGFVYLLSPEGEFLAASCVPEGYPTRLRSTGDELPRLEYMEEDGGEDPEEWVVREWVTPDQGAELGSWVPKPDEEEGT